MSSPGSPTSSTPTASGPAIRSRANTFSKADPSRPGRYDTEFMLSPKLGWCARDASRTVFESHMPMGLHFLLTHDVAAAANRRGGWRSCTKCEAVFFSGDAFKGVCQRDGGPHEPDPLMPDDFSEA